MSTEANEASFVLPNPESPTDISREYLNNVANSKTVIVTNGVSTIAPTAENLRRKFYTVSSTENTNIYASKKIKLIRSPSGIELHHDFAPKLFAAANSETLKSVSDDHRNSISINSSVKNCLLINSTENSTRASSLSTTGDCKLPVESNRDILISQSANFVKPIESCFSSCNTKPSFSTSQHSFPKIIKVGISALAGCSKGNLQLDGQDSVRIVSSTKSAVDLCSEGSVDLLSKAGSEARHRFKFRDENNAINDTDSSQNTRSETEMNDCSLVLFNPSNINNRVKLGSDTNLHACSSTGADLQRCTFKSTDFDNEKSKDSLRKPNTSFAKSIQKYTTSPEIVQSVTTFRNSCLPCNVNSVLDNPYQYKITNIEESNNKPNIAKFEETGLDSSTSSGDSFVSAKDDSVICNSVNSIVADTSSTWLSKELSGNSEEESVVGKDRLSKQLTFGEESQILPSSVIFDIESKEGKSELQNCNSFPQEKYCSDLTTSDRKLTSESHSRFGNVVDPLSECSDAFTINFEQPTKSSIDRNHMYIDGNQLMAVEHNDDVIRLPKEAVSNELNLPLIDVQEFKTSNESEGCDEEFSDANGDDGFIFHPIFETDEEIGKRQRRSSLKRRTTDEQSLSLAADECTINQLNEALPVSYLIKDEEHFLNMATDAPASTDAVMSNSTHPKRSGRGIRFDGVTVFYFSRSQGFSSVPSQGGSTLGMTKRHFHHRKLSLADHLLELRRAHQLKRLKRLAEKEGRDSSLLNINDVVLKKTTDSKTHLPPNRTVPVNEAEQHTPVSCGFNVQNIGIGTHSSDDDETEEDGSELSESDVDSDISFLRPLAIKQRRSLLRESGIIAIDGLEKEECKDIRISREQCGCQCKLYCLPASCSCIEAGIKCQVDRHNFPCGCSLEGCANPHGRIEFNPIRVRTHFLRTLMRLEIEKRQIDFHSPLEPFSGQQNHQNQLLHNRSVVNSVDQFSHHVKHSTPTIRYSPATSDAPSCSVSLPSVVPDLELLQRPSNFIPVTSGSGVDNSTVNNVPLEDTCSAATDAPDWVHNASVIR